MEIIKKNMISVICGVVALAAVVLAFTYVSGKASELQASLDSRAAANQALQSLLTKPRELPLVSESQTPEPLNPFPSEYVIKQGEAITKTVAKESKAMVDAAVAMNRHEPLVPGELPAPNFVAAIGFRTRYQQFYPQVGPNGAPPAMAPGGGNAPATNEPFINTELAKALNAGMPPTADEIRVALDAAINKIKSTMLITQGPNSAAINGPAVDQAIRDRQLKLPEEMKMQVATTRKVYISADTFDTDVKIAGGNQPDPADIFIAQTMLWIQQDVVAAVNDINSKAKNILDAPVKHLLKVSIIPTPILPAAGASTSGDPDAPLVKAPGVSPTARACNPMYDVWHFTVTATVDADKVDDWVRALSKGRLITPLQVELHWVDAATESGRNYVYGDKPVVNVTARCEALFLRKWTEPLRPALIKPQLGVAPAAAGAAGM
jgi:hypothetical protein